MPKNKLDKTKLRIEEANKLIENGDQTAARRMLERVVLEFRNSNSPTITNAKTKLNNLIKAAHRAGKCFYSGVVELLHLENQSKGIIAQLNQAYEYKDGNNIHNFCALMSSALKSMQKCRKSQTNLAIETRMIQLLNEFQNTGEAQFSADLSAKVLKATNSKTGVIFMAFEDDESKGMYLQRLREKGFHQLATTKEIMQQGDVALLQQFIDITDNVLDYDNNGFSPIHYLLMYADKFGKEFETALKILLEKGEIINRKTTSGLTALHILCSTHNQVADPVSLAKILINNGCSVNEESTAGITPLYFATASELALKNGVHIDLVKYLVDSGAHTDLNVTDSQGEKRLQKNRLFGCLVVQKNIPGLNALLQANAAVGINFQIPPELIRQLDAKNGVVISFFNGKLVDKRNPIFRGFKNSITNQEELGAAHLENKVSLDFIVQIETRIEKAKNPYISDVELTHSMTQLKEELTRANALIAERKQIEDRVKFILESEENIGEIPFLLKEYIAKLQPYKDEIAESSLPTLSRK